MAELGAALETQRRRNENAEIYEGYGKRQQLFKTGKRGARRPLSDSEKGDLALKAAGSSEGTQREKAAASQELSAPPEPKGLYKKDEDLLQAIHSAVESPPTEGLSGGDAEEAALAETKETEEPAPPSDEEPPAEEGSVLPSGETQTSLKTNRRLRLAHRAEEWESNCGCFVFAQDSHSPHVVAQAKILQCTYAVRQAVAVRLALLTQFGDVGKRIQDLYIDALETLRRGIFCAMVNPQSLKVSRKKLTLCPFDQSIFIKSTRRRAQLSAPKRVCLTGLHDFTVGTRGCEEFETINKRIRRLGQALQESRCCALRAPTRNYALIMDDFRHVGIVCAVVDLFTARHGPAVWRQSTTDAVFATPIAAHMRL